MLEITLGDKTYKFYTFTDLLGFIQNLSSPTAQKTVAEQAIKLIPTSSIEFELKEYYSTQFNSFIPKTESNETMELPAWYSHLCGFYL